MKKLIAFAVSLLLCFTVGCSNTNVQSAQKPATEPAALTTSDLHDIFASIDLSQANVCYLGNETENILPASKAIHAGRYLETLKGFAWETYQPPVQWDGADDYRYQLTLPGVTMTVFQRGYAESRPLHILTDSAEGWFTMPAQVSWMPFDTFTQWYNAAQAADLFAGQGTPLTQEELDWFTSYTQSVRESYDLEEDKTILEVNPINCFFTSHYSNPRDMSASEFLRYCPPPTGQEPIEEEEFKHIQDVQDWRGEDGHLLTLEEIPVPCRRLPRTYLNEILMQYADITVEEMNTNWMEESVYIPTTDCFYTFTSDFAPGNFCPIYGEKSGDLVILWNASNVLTLQKAGDAWLIRSYQTAVI